METDLARQTVESGVTWQAPLSEAQSGLWYAQRLDPANPIYNTGQYVEIHGPLDIEAFRDAVNAALAESPTLAIRVAETESALQQVAVAPVGLAVDDLIGENNPFSVAQERIARDMSTPLNPTCDDLVHQRLFILGPNHFIWYQRIHHLVIDGYGTSLLTKRICDLYSARVSNRPPLTTPFGSYEAVLAEERAYRESAKWQNDREFWKAEFEDRPEVPGMARGVPVTARTFHRVACDFPPSFAEGMRKRSESVGVSWPDVMVALVSAFIEKHAGGGEAIVGVPTMNRMGSASARVPAMIMNVLPIRVEIDESASLNDWLMNVARKLRDARRRGKYRSEQLRRDLGLLGGQRRLHGPLINVLPFEEIPALAGCESKLTVLGTGAVDDLTFTLRADNFGQRPHLEIDSNPDLYSAEETRELSLRLSTFLDNAVQADRLLDVPVLTPQEHRHWVYEVNATEHAVEDTTLSTLIERTMRAQPDAPALSFEGTTITYADLDARSAALARRLYAAGVRRGDVVAVAIPRSFELVFSLIAAIRLGAAYLPIDIDHPKSRIETMLASAAPRVLLTFRDIAASLPSDVPVLTLDQPASEEMGDIEFDPPRPDDAAYVIFTSGSTGTPKGVVNEDRGIVNRLEWMRTHYGIGPGDRILQKTPATFDVSVWEFFLPFLAGATLVIAPPDAHKDPAWLASIIREERITTMHFVPSMLAAFLAEPSAKGIEMHRVFCSGEELPAALRDRFHQTIRAELHNLYGPTEAAVDVTWWPASPQDTSVPVPIGFPVWNTSMYILDRHLRPVPPEVAADLYIGGVQVARGYLGRPDLTSDRFISDPFRESRRMYKTGDIAYWRRDGALVFLGRSDHQVKIRGLRIELGEIEAAILSSSQVAQTAVLAREDRPGDQRLAAYVTPATVDLDALRSHVAARVPDYMVPSAFVVLDELPLSRNGKIDRAALPKPEVSATAPGRAPETPSEIRLAGLFADVLGIEQIHAEDDFFSLGGHSLLAARLMARVREYWSGEPGLGVLFSHPTVARLAAYLDELEAERTPAETGLGIVIPLVAYTGSSKPALFCVHPAGGISWCYAGLARALNPARPVFGVQARSLNTVEPLPDSLDAMAADYVEQIRRVRPEGPYHLAGWSVGGMIAHTMAVHLQDLGLETGVVALLDSYPSDCWRDQPEVDDTAALKALLHIAGYDPEEARVPLTREAVVEFLRRSGHPLGELSSAALTAVIQIVENNNALVRSHYHRRFEGTVIHFRAALDHVGKNLAPVQWAPYVRDIVVCDVPALHAHMTGPEASCRIAQFLSARF